MGHHPQRLSVYLAASQAAIGNISQKHATLTALADNDWLYINQWDVERGEISQYYRSQWRIIAG